MMIMKKITQCFLALPLSFSLAFGLATPQISLTYAKTKQKAPKKKVKVGQVTRLTKKVVRSNKKNAKITLSWKKAKNAKTYEISLKAIKKTKVKKGKKTKIKKKTVYKKLATIKKCSYSIKKPYSHTYVFGITALNKKAKGKRKTITVKVPSYKKTKKPSNTSSNNNESNESKTQKQSTFSIPEKLTVKVDETKPLTITNGQDVRYSLSDYGYIRVGSQSDSEFTITGLTSGTTTLTVESDGVKKQCVITVEEQYSYKLTPMLAPFADYFYLETNDPDPFDLEFVDQNTIYADAKNDPAIITIDDTHYFDVSYTDLNARRTSRGYIFKCDKSEGNSISDGGNLVMKRKVFKEGNSRAYTLETKRTQVIQTKYGEAPIIWPSETYMDTNVTISLPTLKTDDQYLIDTYTTPNQSFFEKMNAIQTALDHIAVYPRSFLNTSKPTKHYPALCVSRYPELSLNPHSELTYRSYSLDHLACLSQSLYPFVLSSLGFPGTLERVAKKLDPTCTIENTSWHWMIKVTKDGQMNYYGGEGRGGNNPMLDTHIHESYRFDGTSDDYYTKANLDNLRQLLLAYAEYGKEDMANNNELLSGETFKKTVGDGAWLRVGIEQSTKITYDYEMKQSNDNYVALSNTWVDGRYISSHESFIRDTKFDDCKTASIALLNQTITDSTGQPHQVNMLFTYNSQYNVWIDEDDYSYFYGKSFVNVDSTPDEFVLTQDEVKEMNKNKDTALDRNTNVIPEHGLIYDGSAQPGTPF